MEDKNHTPIINPIILFGESSVTFDSPMGDKKSSPVVIKKYPRNTKRKGTFPFSPIK